MSLDTARQEAQRRHAAGSLRDALAAYDAILAGYPQDPWTLRMSAVAHLQCGDAAVAENRLQQLLAVADSLEARLLLAHAQQAGDRPDAARQTLLGARDSFGESADLHNQLGALAQRSGDLAAAQAHYERALSLAPERASIAANLAATLSQQGAARAALEMARRALAADPGLGPAWKVAGSAHAALAQDEEALHALRKAAALSPDDPDAHYQLGVALDDRGDWNAARAAHDRALALKPDFGPALSEALFLCQRLCDWSGIEPLVERVGRAIDSGQPGIKPFSWLSACDDPARQRDCARLWARQVQHRVQPLPTRTIGSADTLRVGYLSSGFHRHPTACLTAEFFERVDPARCRSLVYSVGPDDGSELRRRIRAAAHGFRDLRGNGFRDIASAVTEDRVDILVDLRGYGGGAVTEVLAMRPAPLQVNWLAYPGTMGGEFMDYIVVDPQIATPEVLAALDEQPLILPHSYQPTDTTRPVADPEPDRQAARLAAGLPARATVYCCFNNSYKFSPGVFQSWMQILQAVPDSVLWLLAGRPGTGTDDHLRAQAQHAGIDSRRLHFMPKRPHLEYLAQYRLADLFLDTHPYNAHTTASDALWAGCPVLTAPGRSFAARVAGSLVHSAGLPDLVVPTAADYVARAVTLGRDRAALAALRRRLCDARQAAPLFDTAGFCASLQTGFERIAERARRGQPPAAIDLSRN